MKRISIMLMTLSAILLSSCTYEEDINPSPSQYGFVLSSEAGKVISLSAVTIETAYLIDLWQDAETDSARYAIEDKYFYDYKIRTLSNDTIVIIDLCTIVTHGNKFGEGIWDICYAKYAYGDSFFKIKPITSDTLAIEMYNYDSVFVSELYSPFPTSSDSIVIQGQSATIDYNDFSFWDGYKIEITEPIVMKISNFSWDTHLDLLESRLTQGKFTIYPYLQEQIIEKDLMEVTFYNDAYYVNFRDETLKVYDNSIASFLYNYYYY